MKAVALIGIERHIGSIRLSKPFIRSVLKDRTKLFNVGGDAIAITHTSHSSTKQNRRPTLREKLERPTCMSELLPEELKNALPKISDQEGNKNPTVYAVFQFPLSGWIWFVTEGKDVGGDFLFFGYVVGLEREWGYFCLSELESVDIDGVKVCRDVDHVPRLLSEYLQQYGLVEN